MRTTYEDVDRNFRVLRVVDDPRKTLVPHVADGVPLPVARRELAERERFKRPFSALPLEDRGLALDEFCRSGGDDGDVVARDTGSRYELSVRLPWG